MGRIFKGGAACKRPPLNVLFLRSFFYTSKKSAFPEGKKRKSQYRQLQLVTPKACCEAGNPHEKKKAKNFNYIISQQINEKDRKKRNPPFIC